VLITSGMVRVARRNSCSVRSTVPDSGTGFEAGREAADRARKTEP